MKKARLKKKALRKNVQGKSKREEAVRKTEETSGNKEAVKASVPDKDNQDTGRTGMAEEPAPKKNTMVQDAPEEYTADKAENGKPHYEALAKIGVNVSLGLEYCCGEDDFYTEMLSMFCSQAAEKKAEIISLYEIANWADYTVKVHALKSTSLTIGAERLAEQAKLLEQAGKQGNMEYIRHSHHELLRLYDEVCKTIKQIL